MGETSLIQWTDATWNIARGCTKVDDDCKFCYMYRDGERYKYDPKDVIRTKTVFNLPLRIKEPSKIFTSSLTDFFHELIDEYRDEAWDIIRKCPQHTFQILTKRPERILDHLPADWGDGWNNVWFGTSAGSGADKAMARIEDLRKVKHAFPGNICFFSLEPLHGPIHFKMSQLAWVDWVIIGGESGNETGKYRYRECSIWWMLAIVDQCKFYNIPVFVKQLGTYLAKARNMSDRHGGNINEFPAELQFREMPREGKYIKSKV